jgi:hypothetical protein
MFVTASCHQTATFQSKFQDMCSNVLPNVHALDSPANVGDIRLSRELSEVRVAELASAPGAGNGDGVSFAS